jgi:hypothetical protein
LLLTAMAVFSTPIQSNEYCVFAGLNNLCIKKISLPAESVQQEATMAESPFMLLVI